MDDEYGAKLEERIAELEVEICGEAQTTGCQDGASCDYIPVGNKPCGGPQRYLVYCAATTDAETLEALASEHEALERQYNEEQGLASDCSVPNEPVLGIGEGECIDTSGENLPSMCEL